MRHLAAVSQSCSSLAGKSMPLATSRMPQQNRWAAPRGPWLPALQQTLVAHATPPRQQGQQQGPADDDGLSPQEALLAALRETGLSLEEIQIGRAEGDDETWEDLLDAETDDPWMRSPQVSEVVEELLGGMLPLPPLPPLEQQQQQQGKASGPSS